MDTNTKKKIAVLFIAFVSTVVCIVGIAFLYATLTGFDFESMVAIIAMFAIVCIDIVIIWQANVRFKEIDEGIDDDVNNY